MKGMRDVRVDSNHVYTKFDVEVGDLVIYDPDDKGNFKIGRVSCLESKPYRAQGYLVSVIKKEDLVAYDTFRKNRALKDKLADKLGELLLTGRTRVDVCREVADNHPDIADILAEYDAIKLP